MNKEEKHRLETDILTNAYDHKTGKYDKAYIQKWKKEYPELDLNMSEV